MKRKYRRKKTATKTKLGTQTIKAEQKIFVYLYNQETNFTFSLALGLSLSKQPFIDVYYTISEKRYFHYSLTHCWVLMQWFDHDLLLLSLFVLKYYYYLLLYPFVSYFYGDWCFISSIQKYFTLAGSYIT